MHKIKMKVVQYSPDLLVLRMDANETLTNALRRSINEVPILAVDEVEFFKNDSALYDEVIAHRIGLIPLKTDKKMSGKTSLDLKLSKKGPGTVYSGDFKGSAKIVYDKIPITLLEEGQEIELVATASLGSGLEHAKYVPGLAYYRHVLEVKSKNPKVSEIVENAKSPLKPEKKGDTWICDLPEGDALKIEELDREAIKDSKEVLLFVESFGQLDPKDILKSSVEALENNLVEFEKALK